MFHSRSFVIFGLLLLVPILAAPAPAQLPDKFLGSWVLDHSENFDEYLEAKGYGWFMRQVVKLASITKVFEKKSDNLYNMKVLTSKKDVEWDNVQMNQEFVGEYLDESKHKIVFTYDKNADQLVEKHTKVDSEDLPDVYKYEIDSNGFLLMHMEYKGVATKRYYKKKD